MFKKILAIIIPVILLGAGCNNKLSFHKPPLAYRSITTSITSPSTTSTGRFVPHVAPSLPPPTLPLHTVGQITWHATNFVNQTLRLQGYLLKKEAGYAIFSDESGGAINSHDLPVTGPGVDTVQSKHKYILEGKFIYGGLTSSNNNLYHFELSSPPQ